MSEKKVFDQKSPTNKRLSNRYEILNRRILLKKDELNRSFSRAMKNDDSYITMSSNTSSTISNQNSHFYHSSSTFKQPNSPVQSPARNSNINVNLSKNKTIDISMVSSLNSKPHYRSDKKAGINSSPSSSSGINIVINNNDNYNSIYFCNKSIKANSFIFSKDDLNSQEKIDIDLNSHNSLSPTKKEEQIKVHSFNRNDRENMLKSTYNESNFNKLKQEKNMHNTINTKIDEPQQKETLQAKDDHMEIEIKNHGIKFKAKEKTNGKENFEVENETNDFSKNNNIDEIVDKTSSIDDIVSGIDKKQEQRTDNFNANNPSKMSEAEHDHINLKGRNDKEILESRNHEIIINPNIEEEEEEKEIADDIITIKERSVNEEVILSQINNAKDGKKESDEISQNDHSTKTNNKNNAYKTTTNSVEFTTNEKGGETNCFYDHFNLNKNEKLKLVDTDFNIQQNKELDSINNDFNLNENDGFNIIKKEEIELNGDNYCSKDEAERVDLFDNFKVKLISDDFKTKENESEKSVILNDFNNIEKVDSKDDMNQMFSNTKNTETINDDKIEEEFQQSQIVDIQSENDFNDDDQNSHKKSEKEKALVFVPIKMQMNQSKEKVLTLIQMKFQEKGSEIQLIPIDSKRKMILVPVKMKKERFFVLIPAKIEKNKEKSILMAKKIKKGKATLRHMKLNVSEKEREIVLKPIKKMKKEKVRISMPKKIEMIKKW